MKLVHLLPLLTAGLIGTFAVLPAVDAVAQTVPATLDKVSFGTNWVAEAEHGGFFQALADGTREPDRVYHLNVQLFPVAKRSRKRKVGGV